MIVLTVVAILLPLAGLVFNWYQSRLVEHIGRELSQLPVQQLDDACSRLAAAGPLGLQTLVLSLDSMELVVAEAAEDALRTAISASGQTHVDGDSLLGTIARLLAEHIGGFGSDGRDRSIRLAREILWVGSSDDPTYSAGPGLLAVIEDCRNILAWASVPHDSQQGPGLANVHSSATRLNNSQAIGSRRQEHRDMEESSPVVAQVGFDEPVSGDLPPVPLDLPTLPPPAPSWQHMAPAGRTGSAGIASDGRLPRTPGAPGTAVSLSSKSAKSLPGRTEHSTEIEAKQSAPRPLDDVGQFALLPTGTGAAGNQPGRVRSESQSNGGAWWSGRIGPGVNSSAEGYADKESVEEAYAGIPVDPPPIALFRQLHDPALEVVANAEQRLTAIGFESAELELARDLVDDRSEVRQSIVDRLSSVPRLDVRRWLVWLSRDSDADVRLAALTVMATSSDPVLLRVLEAAGGDDPRVAKLARQRLGTAAQDAP
jgi:hypothetical protein